MKNFEDKIESFVSEEWLRENWFKIGILIVLLVVGLMYVSGANNTQKVSTTDESLLFERRQLCAENRENAKRQMEDSYSLADSYFYDIFYSPKVDSCIYTYGVVLKGTEIGSFIIADYFGSETLESFNYDNSSDNPSKYSYSVRPSFSEKVEEYRQD